MAETMTSHGIPVVDTDKRHRENEVAMEIYGKPFDELAPEQQMYVGRVVGGEHTKGGGYTGTIHEHKGTGGGAQPIGGATAMEGMEGAAAQPVGGMGAEAVSKTGKPIVEFDKHAREEEVAEELYGKRFEELSPEQRRYVGSIVGGEHTASGGYTPTLRAHGYRAHAAGGARGAAWQASQGTQGAQAGQEGLVAGAARSATGKPVLEFDKHQREEEVAMELYGKRFEELTPEQRRYVGSVVGGEHTKSGGYTPTLHAHPRSGATATAGA
ncbi:hypothetical protein WJX72_000096 [[Myrmecia] bisecta]|uniref:Uncharacterized protein n=1 Tax=[Myrmecia] bisecta TaxID=41462 RepID=A0AAW1QPQ1_9CHLO